MKEWASYAARRLAQAVPALLGLSLVTFLLMRLSPGDPAVEIAGPRATPEVVEGIRQDLGLDKGILQQYFTWIGDVLSGDLGMNVRQTRTVTEIVTSSLPATLWITGIGLGLTLVIGTVVGALGAWRPGGAVDWFAKIYSSVGVAVPAFFAGLLLILWVALPTGIFPTSGWPASGTVAEQARAAALPALTLAITTAPILARGLRSAALDIRGSAYQESAQAIGLSPLQTVRWYYLRNATVTVVPLVAIVVTFFIGSSVVVESTFAISGIGSTLVQAVTTRDYEVVQAVVLLIGVFVIAIQAASDLLVAALDPRVKLS